MSVYIKYSHTQARMHACTHNINTRTHACTLGHISMLK